MKSAAVIHPGEILLTEFMEPMGLTAYRLAKDLSVPQPRIGDIVRGKRSISAGTALRLGIYFGLLAQFWLNLQMSTICALRVALHHGKKSSRKPHSRRFAPPPGLC